MKTAIEYNADRVNNDHIVQLVKYWQDGHGLDADGRFGPATAATVDEAIRPVQAPSVWTPWDGPLERRPKGRRGVYQMFGDPGVGKPDPEWERANLITCHVSRGNALPGVPPNRWIQIHKKVEPYAREALRRMTIACPDYHPERVACYVFRHQRHDPSRPLSIHSFAAAIDFDPHLNAARTFKRGEAPKFDSPEWRKIWPRGIPKGVVEAFESCGFAFGSDWDEDGDTTDHTYSDPMHFEFVDRGGRRAV